MQRAAFAPVFFLLISTAYSQTSAGRLSGSVTDASGAAIPNAAVGLMLPGGNAPVLSTRTTADGLFTFATIQPGTYDLTVENAGFARTVVRAVKVDPARETALPVIKLELQTVQQTVEVTEATTAVQTNNIEVSNTVTQNQVQNLPVLDRQVSNLFLTQPGVSSARGPTTINGLRTSMANVTYEGINIQDNFIRSNALDYIPSKFTIEQVAELTVTTANASAAVGNGAAQISQVAPSGSNEYHGSLYWYNRNNRFAANDWFNNQSGVDRPFLNQNQLGGSFGGRIIRDKLFFYGNYEAFRNHQQESSLRTILTPEARQGIFRYENADGDVVSRNILSQKQISINPYIQNLLSQVPAQGNSSNAGDGLNTTGYQFNQRSNEIRDAVTLKVDFIPTSRHALSGTYVWNTDNVDRPDLDNSYQTVPLVFNDNRSKLISAAWRWSVRPTLTNEVRGGMFLAPGSFATRQAYPNFLLGDIDLINTGVSLIINNPQNTFLGQGRDTNTYSIQDNANWVRGRHNVSFGFQVQEVRSAPFNDLYQVPFFATGLPATNNTGFTTAELPGIASTDLATANGLYGFLGGFLNDYRQTLNIRDRNSGYVAGQTNLRHFSYGTWAGYIQDNWKIRPRLTLNLGVRYDYYTRVNERDSLAIMPRLENGNYISTLLNPNATLDFAGKSVGRPFYNRDLNNFAPVVGFAWDVFGSGRTAIRGGYSISYVNDEVVTSARYDVTAAAGLSTTVTNPNLDARVSSPPSIPVPQFVMPRTLAQNYALSTSTVISMPNPDLRTPYVQQWNVGVEHDYRGFVMSARYVGNRGVALLRQVDYNQIDMRRGGFLTDFIRARNNGFASQAANGRFDPTYTGPGGQPLTVFPTLPSGGTLTNSTVIGYLQTGQVAELANYYQTRRANGPISFFPNPNALSAISLNNLASSTYNSLQLDVRKRMSNLTAQFSYVFSKVMGNSAGDDQRRLEALLDNNNISLEKARMPWDVTHLFKANYAVELPFGRGRRLASGPVASRIFGGWVLSGNWTYESGTAFSILSTRGTYNRAANSGLNTASTTLDKNGLDQVTGFFMTGTGPQFISPTVFNPSGNRRAVAPDGSAPFSGQVFFNPGPGEIGGLQRRWFSGPWNFMFDMAVAKRIAITEQHRVELRMEAFNVFNHATFYAGNETSSTTAFNINSATFGKINSLFTDVRRVQFGMYYRF